MLIIFSPIYAVVTYTGFSSLRIIPSARECAMGGAGVISAIGPSAMYYNPALTAALKSFAVNINYTKWFLDTYEQSVFLTRPLPYFNLGLGLVNFNAGELEYRPDHPTENPYGEFNPVDFNFYLNLSRSAAKMAYGISARVYYEKIYEYDVSDLEPQVACPHLPSNVKPVSELKNVKLDQVVIGSCTNGRISDLRIAARILKGKKVSPGLRLIVIPATQKIYLEAVKEGLVEIFVKAGGVFSTPTCGPCLGGHMGILTEGERCLATTNRNFIGRMGSPASEVYLSSPAVAAASAITGRITHPEGI